jgi:hypothetical protein
MTKAASGWGEKSLPSPDLMRPFRRVTSSKIEQIGLSRCVQSEPEIRVS